MCAKRVKLRRSNCEKWRHLMRSTRCSMHQENRRREIESTVRIQPVPIVIGDGTAAAAASSVVESTNQRETHVQPTDRPVEDAGSDTTSRWFARRKQAAVLVECASYRMKTC